MTKKKTEPEELARVICLDRVIAARKFRKEHGLPDDFPVFGIYLEDDDSGHDYDWLYQLALFEAKEKRKLKRKMKRKRAIKRFTGKRAFLSNFHLSPTSRHDLLYPSIEHAFQAAKTFDSEEHEAIRFAPSAREAKKLGRKCSLREDWQDVRLELMQELIKAKFEINPDLSQRLLETGVGELVEGNNWNDTFWGVCKGEGLNHLGRVLMEVREGLRAGVDG